MRLRSLCRKRNLNLSKRQIAQSFLLLLLLFHFDISWGQMVLTSTSSSIIKITGFPAPDCNQEVAYFTYSSTPQNETTLASQVEETLAAIPPEKRIKLEIGKLYRYSLQVETPGGTTAHPALAGRIHGEPTSMIPIYSGEDGVFPPRSKARFLQSKIHPVNTQGQVQFDGLLQFDKESPNGYLCIPYREKGKHKTILTTNIIIPFIVGSPAPGITDTAPTAKAQSTSGAKAASSEKRRANKRLTQPIIGSVANVHQVRQFLKPDAGLKVKGKAKLLTYFRGCPIKEEEPDETEQDLILKVFPNPTNGATNIRYHLPETEEVTVLIYDSQGKAIQALQQKMMQEPGSYQLQWNTAGIPSGMYVVRIHTLTGFTLEKIIVTNDSHR